MEMETSISKNGMGIRGYDFVEFYVGSAKMVAYWYVKTMGFDIQAYSGPETGVKDRVSYYLVQNNIKIVITSAIHPGANDIIRFINLHGDGVKRWSINVESVEKAFSHAVSNGAIPERTPQETSDENGFIVEAAIKLYDDAEIVFFNADQYRGLFRPGFAEPLQNISFEREQSGLKFIDHIVGNVRENEMNYWADYFINTMDFETALSFGPGDISTQYSALLSKVVRTKDHLIQNPINEPYEGIKKSQIEEYIEQYHGTGIQHIAIATDDIVRTIAALRKNGMEFLSVPDTYYDHLKERAIEITEDIEELKEQGILCDVEGTGYLLQLFTKPIGDRPTFFYEIIQRRKGAQGFGQGNFQSLFESIEMDQALRGNLDR
ncbi:MAG: 4-hydroxyphenylpyruvate dioxygenase [Candidatus Marinimicrobia bacterium]|nr:4-hydroxyphenylpyruvate dioxygenase [Candidatus Neomarinimicrobiota bacterium]